MPDHSSSSSPGDRWPHLATINKADARRYAEHLIAAPSADTELAREAVGCWLIGHTDAGLILASTVRERGHHQRDAYLRRESIRIAIVRLNESDDRDIARLVGFAFTKPIPDDADLAAMIAILLGRIRGR